MSKENHLVAKDVMCVYKACKYSEMAQDVHQCEWIRCHHDDNLGYQVQHIEQYAMHSFAIHQMPENRMRSQSNSITQHHKN